MFKSKVTLLFTDVSGVEVLVVYTSDIAAYPPTETVLWHKMSIVSYADLPLRTVKPASFMITHKVGNTSEIEETDPSKMDYFNSCFTSLLFTKARKHICKP